jgi:hypothetical protein
MSGEQVQEITQEQAAQATARLAELKAQPEWNAKLVSMTDGYAEKKEFKALMEASSKDAAKGGDRLDKIIAGTAEIPIAETTVAGQISTFNTMQTAADLREVGLTDPQIKQVLSGEQVSKAEYEKIRILRIDRMGNKEFTTKLFAGDAQTRREFVLMNTVMANGYVGQERTRGMRPTAAAVCSRGRKRCAPRRRRQRAGSPPWNATATWRCSVTATSRPWWRSTTRLPISAASSQRARTAPPPCRDRSAVKSKPRSASTKNIIP